MLKKNFLVEIGTEELPPKILRNLAESFYKNFTTKLNVTGLEYDDIKWFATSRRLALKVINVDILQPDRKVKKIGPSIILAFDAQGKPSKIAESWARRCGITLDQANRLVNDKGEWLFCNVYIKGKHIEDLIPKMVATSLKQLPIPKLMRWGISDVYFVRPVHTVTILLGNKIVSANILGVRSDRIIRGHRFMGDIEFVIDDANQYPQILLDRGKVIADYEIRKAKIITDVKKAANNIGGYADLSDDLLEEVTSLIEWPVVLTAQFEKKFLNIPTEVLIYIMKYDRKYFPVYTSNGQLLPNFIFVANIESSNSKSIIHGNENIMHSRLSDAALFLNIDRQKRLEDNLIHLQSVLFQNQLGTLYDKTHRIVVLSSWLANKIGANINNAIRASLLSKCDLLTNMVCEFTNMQGIIGMYYARYDGESEDIAIALNEQYKPRFSGDQLPTKLTACTVAIADRIDTLVGILGIGYHPKSDTDPFILRRAALGILRIVIEKNLNFDLYDLIQENVRLYSNKLTNINVIDDVINFLIRRLHTWYYDKGYPIDSIKAVLAIYSTNLINFDLRMKAIAHFRTLKEASSLIMLNKRISNILIKSNEMVRNTVCISMLKEATEIKLADNIIIMRDKLNLFYIENRYQEALIELASLQEIVDEFFKKVMINIHDKQVRINRLTLLAEIRKLFLQIADISLLQ